MSSPQPIQVTALYRYPVKSMCGEAVDVLQVDSRGCAGDRLWSVRTPTGKIGSGKNTRRFGAVPGLLELRATASVGGVSITFPDGSWCPVESPEAAALVSRHTGLQVRLAAETDVSHFDDGPVSLIGSASISAIEAECGAVLDATRFRPNLVLDTSIAYEEDRWIGRTIRVGTVVLGVQMASTRCVMVDMQTADLPEQHGVLLATGRAHEACLGVIATVVQPGQIRIGDRVEAAPVN